MVIPSTSNHRRRRQHYGEQPLLPPLNPTPSSFLRSLIHLARDISDPNRSAPSVCQKRNLAVISRRIKILLMLLEELREASSTSHILPPSAILCFGELHVVLQGIKLLVEDCTECSRIWLLMEHRRLSEHFHSLTQEMATALDVLPLPLLDVSFEVREQVELVKKQSRKAKMYVDPKETQIWSDIMSAMAQIEQKTTPDVSKLSDIFKSLGLNSAVDCQTELEKLEEEEYSRAESSDSANSRRRTENYRMKVPFNDLVSFVRYSKCVLYGATETQEEADATGDNDEDNEIKVPDDFRCPISLELMTDPVIVSSGQTYDRASITRWIEGGNQTCPKSGLKLCSNTLIPNYALRSLILQWCASHNVRLQLAPTETTATGRENNSNTTPSPTALEATKLTAEFLLQQLPSAASDTQRQIVGELRFLAKCGSDNRKVIAEAGAIPLLIPLLSSSDQRTQEHAVTAILNLSIFQENKARIVEAGAIDVLIDLMRKSKEVAVSDVARENAAATIFSLSQMTDYAAVIGEKAEAIEGLMNLLREGSQRGKRDAASAIFNIAVYRPNRESLIKAGVVPLLMELLLSSGGALEEEAVAVLAVLVNSEEGKDAVSKESESLKTLLKLVQGGRSPQVKENAAAILVQLCRAYGGQAVLLTQGVRQFHEMVQALHDLLSHGTPRARRKAASLLRTIVKLQSHATCTTSNGGGNGNLQQTVA